MPYANYTARKSNYAVKPCTCNISVTRCIPSTRASFLVIDIETGDYEIDADDLAATKQLLANRPNAVIYGLRIGYPAAYRMGSGLAVKTE